MTNSTKTTLAALLFAALMFNSSNAGIYSLSGTMDVSQALTNAADEGNGTGTILGSYDDATNLLAYTLTWDNLLGEVTNMHFHNGAVGVGGGVDLGIPSPWISPLSASNLVLDETQEANLLAGNWYVNVHTASFGGGEIRGQVLVNPVPEPAAGVMAGFAFLATLALRRRRQ